VDHADMHLGKQPPLDIHLGFGAWCEAVQSFLNADIGKHRLDYIKGSVIDLFTLDGVYLGFNLE